jgi:hypothetical protein
MRIVGHSTSTCSKYLFQAPVLSLSTCLYPNKITSNIHKKLGIKISISLQEYVPEMMIGLCYSFEEYVSSTVEELLCSFFSQEVQI